MRGTLKNLRIQGLQFKIAFRSGLRQNGNLLFLFTNSLAEELIFRFALVGGLFNRYSSSTVLLCSAVMFGFPHYWGYPSGVVGVLMSGLLGYVLCKATIETKGLSIAWLIHFVQDLIIFTALFMMNVK